MGAKLTLALAKTVFAKQGCILLASEYVSADTLMPYICACGEKSMGRLRSVQRGQKCKVCGLGKHTLNTARKLFAEGGCELLADQYENNYTPMPYICECGSIAEICLANFRNGQRCAICGRDRRIHSARVYTFEYVYRLFKLQGHELLHYNGTKEPLLFRCKCGREDSIIGTSLAVHSIRVCKVCKEETKRPQFWRQTPAYRAWKLGVLYRDDYTCIGCKASIHADQGAVLHAHHITSPENNLLAYDEDNGATLCITCHTKYHTAYGKVDCTEETFKNFLAEVQRVGAD